MWAALQVAMDFDENTTIVVLLPDSGRGYLSKIYSDQWMQDNGFLIACRRPCASPICSQVATSTCRSWWQWTAGKGGTSHRHTAGVRHLPDAGCPLDQRALGHGHRRQYPGAHLAGSGFREPDMVENAVNEVMDEPLQTVDVRGDRSDHRSSARPGFGAHRHQEREPVGMITRPTCWNTSPTGGKIPNREYKWGRNGKTKRRVLVIGLDCAAPELVFDQFQDDLPVLSGLIDSSLHGKLRSAIPPITVPAWASMMTSKDPGQLGFYGFRNRTDRSYSKMGIVNSQMVREPAVWDIVSRAGGKVVVMGVPRHIPKPVNGVSIGCFMTPSTNSNYTYPANLKWEIQDTVGDYMVDVPDFRTEEKERLLRDIYTMTERRFALARHLMDTRDWDFFHLVEMGTDRIHHGFWHYMDPQHPKYEPGALSSAIHDYYQYVDGQIATLLERVDDNTTVLVVSDHGAKRMDGGVCINEWLMQEGLLTIRAKPPEKVPLEQCEVDWDNTMAWASGDITAGCFNVAGRSRTAWSKITTGAAGLKDPYRSHPRSPGQSDGHKAYIPRKRTPG
jgi:predicted AlkP superfamily phosphohydrolase/phosphomutase